MTQTVLKHIVIPSVNTTVNCIVSGNVTSLILPSSTIPEDAYTACKCDLQTGDLTLLPKNTTIRDSTLREMDNIEFRICVYENSIPVRISPHDPSKDPGLYTILKAVVDDSDTEKIKFCYGGDMISDIGSFHCLMTLADEYRDKQFMCKTGNLCALQDLSTIADQIPHNLMVFCEDISFDAFPTIARVQHGTVEDSPSMWPDSYSSFTVNVTPKSIERRKHKVSWWKLSSPLTTT